MSSPTTSKEKRFKDFIEGLFYALLAALVIRQLLVQAYTIPTASMEDTLLVGDFLLVNKFNYGMRTPDWIGIPYTKIGVDVPWFRFPGLRDPKQYDVVIFRYPLDPSMDYIKRCIGEPGQEVRVVNKKTIVDGIPFPIPPSSKYIDPVVYDYNQGHYIFPTFKNLGSRDNYGPIKLPDNCYWMMGDNRDNSSDSRQWGFVTRDHIVGQGLIIYFSWDSRVPWSQFYKKIRFSRIGTVIR